MKQLGLVSLYGQKPSSFENLVKDCQELISKYLGDTFLPYDIGQIHGTIISLAQLRDRNLYNLHHYKLTDELIKMDIVGYLTYLKSEIIFPFTIRIGGFDADDAPFLSKGCKPYARSFFIMGIKALMIGWPLDRESIDNSGLEISNLLGKMRKAGERFNIPHMYNSSNFVDNEYYFRIGILREQVSEKVKILEVENAIREYLSSNDPVFLEINLRDLSLVLYEDETLPLETTDAIPIVNINDTSQIYHLLR